MPLDSTQACQNQGGHCVDENICPRNISEIVHGLCPGQPKNIRLKSREEILKMKTSKINFFLIIILNSVAAFQNGQFLQANLGQSDYWRSWFMGRVWCSSLWSSFWWHSLWLFGEMFVIFTKKYEKNPGKIIIIYLKIKY